MATSPIVGGLAVFLLLYLAWINGYGSRLKVSGGDIHAAYRLGTVSYITLVISSVMVTTLAVSLRGWALSLLALAVLACTVWQWFWLQYLDEKLTGRK